MAVWIDIKYINLVGFQLPNFKWVRPNKLANCSCPLCGDSTKDKYKARGYFMIDSDRATYFCHNCSASMSLGKFLEIQFPLEQSEYSLETFQESRGFQEPVKKSIIVDTKPVFAPKEFLELNAVRLSSLPKEHPVNQYVTSRQIDFPDLWYTETFKDLTITFEPSYSTSNMVNEPRLIIPFRNTDKSLSGFQGRALGNSKMRYVTIKKDDADIIFGLDRVDFKKNVPVFEGALDSTFVPNALAANGSSLSRFENIFTQNQLDKMIYVYDNEPRNPQIVSLMKRMLDKGNRVVVWNKDTPKDINLMILSGMTPRDIAGVLCSSVTSGAIGLLKLAKWRKC
jgi:hypothetical protein